MTAQQRARMANAFAQVEADNIAAGRQDDQHARELAEWARKHRTKLENRLAAGEPDTLTMDLFTQETRP